MLRARTIMTKNVIAIKENATITAAADLMVNKYVSNLVVTKNNEPIAIVTENNLIKGTLKPRSKNIKVKDVMTKEFLIVDLNTTYSYIVEKLRKEKIKRFAVVDSNKLVGIITETDIVDATRDFTRFHQIMQEVILMIFGLVTAFFLFFFSPLGQSLRESLFQG